MNPRGLWNSLRSAPVVVDERAAVDTEAPEAKHV
jgi:hypothetical protein